MKKENPAQGNSNKESKTNDYKSYLHPSAHDYLPKEEGTVSNVNENEAGTFDTSELEGDEQLKEEEE